MTTTLAQADAAVLMSIAKPIIFVIVLGLWARAITWIDKDLQMFALKRRLGNAVLMAVTALAFGLWLLVPIFWLGLPIVLVLLAGTLVGYHFYRNTRVPAARQWRLSLDSFKQWQEEREVKSAISHATVKLLDSSGEPAEVPVGEHPMAPAHAAFEDLVEHALPRRAERIDMLADGTQAVVAVQIDGVRYPQGKLEPQVGLTMIDYLKHHAGLDVSDRRRKQTGRFKLDADTMGRHTLEVSTSGTTRGVTMSMEIDPAATQLRAWSQLGMLEPQRQALEAVIDKSERGIVLVACPPHQGLTTTLLSLTSRHDAYTQSIITLEEEPERELEGVKHLRLQTGDDAPTLDRQVATIMLSEPRVFTLSSLTDPRTARVLADHAAHARCYVGMRQADTLTGLKAWVQAVGDKKLAGAAVLGVISQRLLRKLCTTCRAAYRPDPAVLKKLNLPPDRVAQLYKHSGQVMVKDRVQTCPDCMGLGYRGRFAVFEVMPVDAEAQQLIAAGDMDQLRVHVRKHRMLWLQEAALAKAVEGVTSISEITRVLGGK